MRRKYYFKVTSLALVMALSGCANKQATKPQPQASKIGTGAVLGGLLGAAVGLATGDGGSVLSGTMIGAGAGAAAGAIWDSRYQAMQKEFASSGISLEQLKDESDVANGIMLDAPNDVLFAKGSYELLDTAAPILKKIVAQAVEQNLQVDVSGNDMVGQIMMAYLQEAGMPSQNIIMSSQLAGGVNYASSAEDESLTALVVEKGVRFMLRELTPANNFL